MRLFYEWGTKQLLKYGEELCAWVKMKEGETMTEQDVKDYCQGKIARFKIPRYVMFVNEFPITISGKIQKFRMRDESIKFLGLEDASRIQTA